MKKYIQQILNGKELLEKRIGDGLSPDPDYMTKVGP
jgi:hypothetical protein